MEQDNLVCRPETTGRSIRQPGRTTPGLSIWAAKAIRTHARRMTFGYWTQATAIGHAVFLDRAAWPEGLRLWERALVHGSPLRHSFRPRLTEGLCLGHPAGPTTFDVLPGNRPQTLIGGL